MRGLSLYRAHKSFVIIFINEGPLLEGCKISLLNNDQEVAYREGFLSKNRNCFLVPEIIDLNINVSSLQVKITHYEKVMFYSTLINVKKFNVDDFSEFYGLDKIASLNKMPSRFKRAVLFQSISPNVIDSGNKKILDQLIRHLLKQNIIVSLVFLVSDNIDIEDLRYENVEVFRIHTDVFLSSRELGSKSFDKFSFGAEAAFHLILSLFSNIDMIVAQYASLGRFFRHVVDIDKIVCFTHDVQFRLKHELLNKDIDVDLGRLCTRGEEVELLSNFSVIVSINLYERNILQNMLPSKKHITVGMYLEKIKAIKARKYPMKRLLFVGSSNSMNTKGLRIFLSQVWPKLLTKKSDIELNVVGNVGKDFNSRDYTNVNFLGVVDKIEDKYVECNIALNFTMWGTGLKIKTVEPIGYGKAVVTTGKGAEGIDYTSEYSPGLIVSDSIGKMYEILSELLEKNEEVEKLEEASRAYSKKYLTEDYIYQEFDKELLSTSLKTTNNHFDRSFFIDVGELKDWNGHYTGIQNVLLKFIEEVSEKSNAYLVGFCSDIDSFTYLEKRVDRIFLETNRTVSLDDLKNGVYLNMGRGWERPDYLRYLKKNRVVNVYHFVHDMIPLISDLYFPERLRKKYLNWVSDAIKVSNSILTNSENSKKDILSLFPKCDVTVAHLGDEVTND